MKFKPRRRKCRCCKTFFTPDVHNPNRQLFCCAEACRRASKAASQRRWLNKSANRNYFRDATHVERVRQWRKKHPGYWKRPKGHSDRGQSVDTQWVNPETSSCNAPERNLGALQDFALTEHPAFVGLMSLVTGSTLQEDIAALGRNLLLRGKNILGLGVREKPPPSHDSKTIDPTGPRPANPAQLQLG